MDLVQVIREMGIQQMMFALQYNSPDEEIFTARLKDLILANGPLGTFETVASLLAPYIDRPVHEVTGALAKLGDVEVCWQGRTIQIWTVAEKGASHPHPQKQAMKSLPKGQGEEGDPVKVSRRQMWFDLVAAGLAEEKLDGQPLEVLLAP